MCGSLNNKDNETDNTNMGCTVADTPISLSSTENLNTVERNKSLQSLKGKETYYDNIIGDAVIRVILADSSYQGLGCVQLGGVLLGCVQFG